MVKARELAAAREKRWKELCDAREQNNKVVRAGWTQTLSHLPSWKSKTQHGKKHPRSSFVVKPTGNPVMVDGGADEPVPGPSRETHQLDPRAQGMVLVVEQVDKDILEDTEDEDEVFLRNENKVAAAPQGPKRKKKQGKPSGVPHTFDQMTKDMNKMFSDEYYLELFDNNNEL